MKQAILRAIEIAVRENNHEFIRLLWQQPLEKIEGYFALHEVQQKQNIEVRTCEVAMALYGEQGALDEALTQFRTDRVAAGEFTERTFSQEDSDILLGLLNERYALKKAQFNRTLEEYLDQNSAIDLPDRQQLALYTHSGITVEERMIAMQNRAQALGSLRTFFQEKFDENYRACVAFINGCVGEIGSRVVDYLRRERETIEDQHERAFTALNETSTEMQGRFSIPHSAASTERCSRMNDWLRTESTKEVREQDSIYRMLDSEAKEFAEQTTVYKFSLRRHDSTQLLSESPEGAAFRAEARAGISRDDVMDIIMAGFTSFSLWHDTPLFEDRGTIYHLAARYDQEDYLDFLAGESPEHRATILNTQDADGSSVFHTAMSNNNIHFAVALLDRGVDLTVKKAVSSCALSEFSSDEFNELREIEIGVWMLQGDFSEALYDKIRAISAGTDEYQTLEFTYEEGHQLGNLLQQTDRAALCAKIQYGRQVPAYEAQDMSGRTLATYAAEIQNLVLLQQLKECYEPAIHAPDREGRTPLEVAWLNGHLEAVKFLIQSGADLTNKVVTQGEYADQPILVSTHINGNNLVAQFYEQGDREFVMELLERIMGLPEVGPSLVMDIIQTCDRNHNSLLHVAQRKGDSGFAFDLIKTYHADIFWPNQDGVRAYEVRNGNGRTLLHDAAIQGRLSFFQSQHARHMLMVENALKGGQSIESLERSQTEFINFVSHASDPAGNTVLHLAMDGDHHQIAFYLIVTYKNLDIRVVNARGVPACMMEDSNGLPLVHSSVRYRSLDAFTRLVNTGVVDIDDLDREGRSLWEMLSSFVEEESTRPQADGNANEFTFRDFREFITAIILRYREACIASTAPDETLGVDEGGDAPGAEVVQDDLPEVLIMSQRRLNELRKRWSGYQRDVLELTGDLEDELRPRSLPDSVSVEDEAALTDRAERQLARQRIELNRSHIKLTVTVWDRISNFLITRSACERYKEKQRRAILAMLKNINLAAVLSYLSQDDVPLYQTSMYALENGERVLPGKTHGQLWEYTARAGRDGWGYALMKSVLEANQNIKEEKMRADASDARADAMSAFMQLADYGLKPSKASSSDRQQTLYLILAESLGEPVDVFCNQVADYVFTHREKLSGFMGLPMLGDDVIAKLRSGADDVLPILVRVSIHMLQRPILILECEVGQARPKVHHAQSMWDFPGQAPVFIAIAYGHSWLLELSPKYTVEEVLDALVEKASITELTRHTGSPLASAAPAPAAGSGSLESEEVAGITANMT